MELRTSSQSSSPDLVRFSSRGKGCVSRPRSTHPAAGGGGARNRDRTRSTWDSAKIMEMSASQATGVIPPAYCRAIRKARVAPKFCRTYAGFENLRWRPRHSPLVADSSEDYIYGPAGTPVEQIALNTSTPTYLTYTPSNSTWISTNAAGDETSYWGYDAFGNLAFGAPTSPFGYSGQYTDANTGLVNDRARFYEPQTGGFTTRDPAFATTETAYTYADGDPVNGSDPSGLCLQGPPDAPPINCAGRPVRTSPASPPSAPPSTAIPSTPLSVQGFVFTWCGNIDPSGQDLFASCEIQTAVWGGVTGSGSEGWYPNFQNPAIPPGPRTSWRWGGKQPEGGELGAWTNDDLDISLHPDFLHDGDVAPHYDLNLPNGQTWRWYPGDWFQLSVRGDPPWTIQELNELNDLVGEGSPLGVTSPGSTGDPDGNGASDGLGEGLGVTEAYIGPVSGCGEFL